MADKTLSLTSPRSGSRKVAPWRRLYIAISRPDPETKGLDTFLYHVLRHHGALGWQGLRGVGIADRHLDGDLGVAVVADELDAFVLDSWFSDFCTSRTRTTARVSVCNRPSLPVTAAPSCITVLIKALGWDRSLRSSTA
ncbi:hypothetical protein [Rhodoferax sp. AJA081-3]|uniref:hypothetical protein n=1 Tax=Rhodoferax sp. AJA081-3 TaxID=2752316 RepID=UPI001AE0BCAB|nr:hypothetical protein [Rhodoferax sp. AJA081-3]